MKIAKVDSVAAVYSGTGRASLDHLDDHVTRAKGVFDRWINASTPVNAAADVPARAFVRVNQARTLASKGKDSMKDCVVAEIYLDAARQLRAAGLHSAIVFVSSNTKDYCEQVGTVLRADLAQEFAVLGMEYAPNLAAAKHSLGL